MSNDILSFQSLADELGELTEADSEVRTRLSDLGIEALLSSIYVADFQFLPSEEGLYCSGALGLEGRFGLPLPGDVVRLGFGEERGGLATVRFELVKVRSHWVFRLAASPITLEIQTPLLRAATLENGYPAATDSTGLTIQIDADCLSSSSALLSLSNTSFSLGLIEIAETGLFLELEQCRLVYGNPPQSVVELGYDQQFTGIAVREAKLYWLPQIQLHGLDFPGLRLTIGDAAVGNQGVSLAVLLSWPVAFTADGRFDPPNTGLLGSLFDDDWQIAIAGVSGTIRKNIPYGLGVNAYLRVPFFDAVFSADFHLTLPVAEDGTTGYRTGLGVKKQSPDPISVSYLGGGLQLTIDHLDLVGLLSDGGFELQGDVGFAIGIHGFSLSADSAALRYSHLEGKDLLEFSLTDVQLDDFGQAPSALLRLAARRDEDGEWQLDRIEILGKYQWQAISGLIQLDALPPMVPLPPDDGELELRISWSDGQINFAVQADLEDVHRLWPFIPAELRPEVDEASLGIALTRDSGSFKGDLTLAFRLRLPDLATLGPLQAAGLSDVVELDTGDENRWISLRFEVMLDDGGTGRAGAIKASMEEPAVLSMQLPGLLLPQPPIRIGVDSIAIELTADGADATGAVALGGSFLLRPVLPETLNGFVPPVMAQQVHRLLAIARDVDLSGTAALTLGLSADNAWFSAECDFEEAGLRIDLFDVFADLLVGTAGPASADSASEIDLDIEVGVELRKIHLSLGSEQAQPGSQIPFSFGFITELSFAGHSADLGFELTHEHLAFGFDLLKIPLAVPKLPLSRDDLDRLRDGTGAWSYEQNWQTTIAPELDTGIVALEAQLATARQTLDDLRQSGGSDTQIFEQEFRVVPGLQRDLFQLVGRRFLYQAVMAVYRVLEELGADGSKAVFQQYMEVYQDAVDSIFGSLHFDTRLQLEITDARFVLPFDDPSDIRAEGGASITGFVPDDPLAPLQDLVFKLGISADAVFFSVEGGVDPIPLPDFGRYPGNAVHLDRLVIGYGYSKNSLVVDFAGELILSEQLIEDADTSAELGLGVRLPRNSSLQFKLDLIPVVLGEVDFLIPLVAFAIDLRSATPPPASPADGQCRPAWDGLELHVPGVIRGDIKAFKLSPFFGPLPAFNGECAFDLELGNQDYGLRQIADYRVITPVLGTIPIPFLADSTPFFERYCLSLRLGGFALGFDLTRPFPHPSPLLIFELLGFLSDPSLPIDPNGHLADLMYAELHHACMTLPPAVQAMFPAGSGVLNRDFRGKINVATVIATARQVQGLAEQIAARLCDATEAGGDWVQGLMLNPPEYALGDLLAILPQDLLSLELHGRLIHFDASATFLMALARDIAATHGETPGTLPPAPPETPLYELVYGNDFSGADLSTWSSFDYGLKGGKGDWQVASGQLLQKRNVGDNSPARYGAMLIYEGTKVGSFRLDVRVASGDDDGLGLIFHFQGRDSFYRFRMTEQQGEWVLSKLRDGRTGTLFSSESRFQRDRQYRIRIEADSEGAGGAGLSRRYSRLDAAARAARRAAGRDIGAGRPPRRPEKTRIRIWVDERLWCDVEDRTKPLTEGQVGVDSWWNTGARFDDFLLYRPVTPKLALGQAVGADQLLTTAFRLSGEAHRRPDVLAGFDAGDVTAAMGAAGELSVAMAARVRIFGSQVVAMLGAIGSDGVFRLVSGTSVEPIVLTVAGLEVPIPLQIEGRMVLEGIAAGADSRASIEALVFGDWTVIPGPDPESAVARLLIGSAKAPVELRLDSDRTFSVRGGSWLELFAQQVVVSGELDASHSHAMIAGDLVLAPDLFVGTDRLLELRSGCTGRLGPGAEIDLDGEGELMLLGKPFTATSVEVSNRVIELKARLEAGVNSGTWPLGDMALNDVQLQLAGTVDLREAEPLVSLVGQGELGLFGARIQGECRFLANGLDWVIGTSGRLSWQGRDWLDGAMQIGTNGVELRGRADFGLALAQQQLPANIQLAGLHLNATISGGFRLDTQGLLVGWELDLDWQLAVRFPDTDHRQALPIATQQIKVHGAHTGSTDVIELADLIAFDGITLLDLQNVTIPIPTLDPAGGKDLYLHQSVSMDVDGGGASFTYLTPIPPSPDASPVFNFVISVYEAEVTVDAPAISTPIPVLSDDPQHPGDAPWLSIPGLLPGEQAIGKIRLDDARFHLKLAWKEGQLGILVVDDNRFVPFGSGFQLGLVFGAIGFLNG